jgi:hypothetical protein
MKDTTQEFASHISKLNSTFCTWGRFEFIVKTFWSGSIYISCEDVLEDNSSDAAKVILALQQLRLPTLESMSSSEQFTLFEAFLSALEPLDYVPIKSMQVSPYPASRSGYVKIPKEDAYDFVMTSALYLEGSNSSESSISYFNAGNWSPQEKSLVEKS